MGNGQRTVAVVICERLAVSKKQKLIHYNSACDDYK